jgi:hypothetical protein
MSGWFCSDLTYDDYASTDVVEGASFETDSRLNLTGVPINNSATLTLEATVNTGGAEHQWFVFLEYVCTAKSFLTNVKVKM